MDQVFIYFGSLLLVVWGIAHIVPTMAVVRGFGPISDDNKKIITMEWVAEGMILCFIGSLATLLTMRVGLSDPTAVLALQACGIMSLVMAVWTLLTGSRTKNIPIKICPIVKTVAAICVLWPTLTR